MVVNGEGTIQPAKDKRGRQRHVTRNGKDCLVWRGRFSMGYDDQRKKYVYSPWRTFYGNKGDARKGMEAYRNELERGVCADANTMTFYTWANNYCKEREIENAAAPSTLAYERNQVRILCLYLGNIKLRNITAHSVKQILLNMAEDGRSSDAIRKALFMLKRLLSEACTINLIQNNPAGEVKPVKAKKSAVKALSAERVAVLLNKLQICLIDETEGLSKESLLCSHKANVMAVRLLLASGMRSGEVLGLTWKHIDLKQAKVRIEQQQTRYGIGNLKTDASRRTITIDKGTAELLKAWKREQASYLLKNGVCQNEDTPVLSSTGHYTHNNNFSVWWRTFRKIYGFDDVNIHMFRHTHATLLIADGVDIKTVQHRLGHETASITMDLYAHFIKSKDAECAVVFDGVFSTPLPEEKKVINL